MAFHQIFNYSNNNNLTKHEPTSTPIDPKALFSPKITTIQKNSTPRELVIENIIEINNISYPIVSDSDKLTVLSEAIYISNQFFLTILDNSLFNDICKYTNSYSLIVSNTVKLRIVQLQKSSEVINNSMCLVIFKVSNYEFLNNIVKQDIINYNDFIYMERLGLNCKIITNYSSQINGKISNIFDNSILVSSYDKINQGSPLIINDKVIGLFYKTKSNEAYYLRLSRITYWLCNFISIPYNIPVDYSNQELYNVIVSLSDKVKELENKINNISSNNQLNDKKIDPLIYKLISSDE
jgi:hypothetical protein